MNPTPERGIPHVNLPDQPAPQTHSEKKERKEHLRELATLVHDQRAIDPREAQLFLNANLERDPSILENLGTEVIAPASIAGAALGIQTFNDFHPDFDTGFDFPLPVHDFLNRGYQILADSLQAPTTDVLDHIPGLMMTGLLVGGVARLRQLIRRKQHDTFMYDEQQSLARQVADGTASYDMSQIEGSFLGYTGKGHAITDTIAQEYGERFMQIAHEPVDGLHVVLPPDTTLDTALDAMVRADVLSADMILIFPSAEQYEVFPPDFGREYNEMGVDRITSFIRRSDQLCVENGVDPKPVGVVGNKKQLVVYVTAKGPDPEDNHYDKETLEARLIETARKREAPTEMIDITDLTMQAIRDIVGDRDMLIAGSGSIADYRVRFFEDIENHRRLPWNREEPQRVVLNKSDRTTEGEAGPDDIPIIRDPSKVPALVEKGVPKEHIMVLPQIVLDGLRNHPELGKHMK
jgi:hypothetical protein